MELLMGLKFRMNQLSSCMVVFMRRYLKQSEDIVFGFFLLRFSVDTSALSA